MKRNYSEGVCSCHFLNLGLRALLVWLARPRLAAVHRPRAWPRLAAAHQPRAWPRLAAAHPLLSELPLSVATRFPAPARRRELGLGHRAAAARVYHPDRPVPESAATPAAPRSEPLARRNRRSIARSSDHPALASRAPATAPPHG